MPWQQVYNPLNNPILSTLAALFPVVVLLGSLGLLKLKAHISALLGLVAALLVALLVFNMPVKLATISALFGAAYGLFPIGWIIINVIFLYNLANKKGLFKIMQENLMTITYDRRLQLIMVAFCFGAFFEGAAGFGTPVAVCASMLIGLGFPALPASGLSLMAITAPVPFAALGTPLVALQSVTGLDLHQLSMMVGRQMVFFTLLIPFYITIVFSGWKGVREVFPALLVVGGTYAVTQLVISNLHGPWLVNIVSSLLSLGVLVFFLKKWQPKSLWRFPGEPEISSERPVFTRKQIVMAWLPWIILCLMIFLWGLPGVKSWLDQVSTVQISVAGLDQQIMRMPPVVTAPRNETAIYSLNLLSATGTAILFAGLISGFVLGYSVKDILKTYAATLYQVRFSLLTIICMLSLGYVIRYCGMDGVLGIAFSNTGILYPFFGTLLGWLGVALTGSDTSSNVLFGSLQRITAEQLGINPVLMASANSSGGVMGKMIDPQSIVVASTATRWYGHESEILKYVFIHSLVLAVSVALLVLLEAYVPPFTWMIPH